MNANPIRTEEEQAAIDAMRLEIEEEERAFTEWLNQPIDDPNPNRWH